MVCQCEPGSFKTNCRKNQLVMMEQRACLSMRVEALSRVARIRTCRVRIRSAGGLSHSRAKTPAKPLSLEQTLDVAWRKTIATNFFRASSKPFEPHSTLEPRSTNPSSRANPSSVEQTLRASSKPCRSLKRPQGAKSRFREQKKAPPFRRVCAEICRENFWLCHAHFDTPIHFVTHSFQPTMASCFELMHLPPDCHVHMLLMCSMSTIRHLHCTCSTWKETVLYASQHDHRLWCIMITMHETAPSSLRTQGLSQAFFRICLLAYSICVLQNMWMHKFYPNPP